MTTNDYVTQKDQYLLTSLPFNKRPVSCPQLWEGTDKAFRNPQFWLYLYKITWTLMLSLLAMSLG